MQQVFPGEMELSYAIVASYDPVCMDWNYWTPGVFHLLIIVYILTRIAV